MRAAEKIESEHFSHPQDYAEAITAEYEPVLEALADMIAVARAALVASGTDQEFADVRVVEARAALRKVRGA
jgi:hypothetical protein